MKVRYVFEGRSWSCVKPSGASGYVWTRALVIPVAVKKCAEQHPHHKEFFYSTPDKIATLVSPHERIS